MTRSLVAEIVAERRWMGLARANTKNAHDAEEALQRAAEIALRKLPTDDAHQARCWFYTVLRRECWAICKRARILQFVPLSGEVCDDGTLAEVADPSARHDPETHVEVRELLHHIADLKPGPRKAIIAIAGGYSYAEFGQADGRSHRNVDRQLTNARQELRARAA